MATTITFEVNILSGGRVLITKDKDKAQKFFDELAAYMAPEHVYLQVWNGSKLVSEQVANKQKEN